MHRRLLRRLVVLALAMCALTVIGVGFPARPAWAHNTLLSSDPPDGAELSEAPVQITWMFDNTVPLETMTVTLIDATGARSELSGSVHGSTGDTQVVTPLASVSSGPVSLRWRLVGPDGHPITGRVDFTIAAAPATVEAAASTTPPTGATAPPARKPVAGVDLLRGGDGLYSTPSVLRWILRYVSYVAIMAIVGILLTSAFVWAGAGVHPVLRRILGRSLLATAALGLLQLLVIASDVTGRAPWSSFGSIEAATTTDAGMAFAIRIVLALTMWKLLFRHRFDYPDIYWTALSFIGLGLLGTWAFAGHSRSMRWPQLGVVTDIAHHGAAATWIAGLAIVGWIVIPRTPTDVLVPAMRKFSQVAAISVAVLVATGVVQGLRLVGSPMDLLDANHGRYLVAKIAVLAAMLGIANANRRRVDHRLDDPESLHRHTGTLRRSVVAEFAIGLVIVGITAAMVVSPPSSSEIRAGARTSPSDVFYIV